MHSLSYGLVVQIPPQIIIPSASPADVMLSLIKNLGKRCNMIDASERLWEFI